MEAIMMAVSALLEMALMMLVLVAAGVVDDYRKRRKARQERG